MFRSVFCLAFCLASTAAAQSGGSFSVPCQSRDEFASRLRTLLAEPQRADEVLARFTIDIAAGADGSWTLTVTEPANPASQPRTLRQASCNELAEAAVLVVSAWADESPPPAAPAPPPAAAPAPPPPPPKAAPPAEPLVPPVPDDTFVPRMRVGVSFRANGAIYMMPDASFGGGAGVWFYTADRLSLWSVGLSAWPSHYMDDAQAMRYPDYERPLWYLYGDYARYFLRFPPVSLGLFGQATFNMRRKNEGGTNELTFSMAVGPDVRWAISDRFAAHAQVGVFIVHDTDTTPGVATLALELTLN